MYGKPDYVVHSTTNVTKAVRNQIPGCFDECVIVDKYYGDIEIDASSMYDIINGDKLKNKLFNAISYDSYKLKKGMMFSASRYNNTVFYFHDLGNKILIFSIYSYLDNPFNTHFVRNNTKPINNIYDLKGVDISCFYPTYLGSRNYEFISEDKMIYRHKDLVNGDISKKVIENCFKAISKNIVVDKVDISKSNDDKYICDVHLHMTKVSIENVDISEIMAHYHANTYFIKDEKLYVIDEKIVKLKMFKLLKNNIINEVCGDYHHFLGKKLVI